MSDTVKISVTNYQSHRVVYECDLKSYNNTRETIRRKLVTQHQLHYYIIELFVTLKLIIMFFEEFTVFIVARLVVKYIYLHLI